MAGLDLRFLLVPHREIDPLAEPGYSRPRLVLVATTVGVASGLAANSGERSYGLVLTVLGVGPLALGR